MSRSQSPPINITITNFPNRFFADKNVICGLSMRVPFSRYYAKAKLILNKYANENEIEGKYILCPIYGRKQDNKTIPTGIQIGLTGKAKTTERIKSAVNREISNEFGVIVPYDKLDHIISDINNPSLFLINTKNIVSATYDSGLEHEHEDEEDDINRKIGICIVGNKEESLKILEDKCFNYRYSNREDDDIAGVICIPVLIALEQMGN